MIGMLVSMIGELMNASATAQVFVIVRTPDTNIASILHEYYFVNRKTGKNFIHWISIRAMTPGKIAIHQSFLVLSVMRSRVTQWPLATSAS